MGKENMKKKVRDGILEKIRAFLISEYDTDVEAVKSGEIMMPCMDDDGNEIYAVIKVSIPRGTRNGEGGYIPYDGYKAAEAYKEDEEIKAKEQAAKKLEKEEGE